MLPLSARATPITLEANVNENGYASPPQSTQPLPDNLASFATNGSVNAYWTGPTYNGGTLSGSAAAAGDIRSGILTAAGSSQYTRDPDYLLTFVHASAQLSDTLTFNIANADTNTVTLITFTLNITGAYNHAYTGNSAEFSNLTIQSLPGGTVYFQQNFEYDVPTSTLQSTWLSSSSVILDQTTVQFTGTYALLGANPQLYILDSLQTVFGSGDNGSFSSVLGLQLPDGVTYTSASGKSGSE
jgi:hypothetical protein